MGSFTMKNLRERLSLGLLFSVFFCLDLLLTKPATAHHMMDGQMPSNFVEGLLSGFGHPLIGLDHFAFIISIGLCAIGQRFPVIITASFLLTSMMGTLLHVMQFDLPFTEIAIALSVMILGFILAKKSVLDTPYILLFSMLSGCFHGYAYGESIIGAETTPLLAYLLGLTLIQFVVAMSAFIGGTLLQKKWEENLFSKLFRFSGVVITMIGALFLVRSISL